MNLLELKNIEDMVFDPATIKNGKFIFRDGVKKIRIDVGLSTEGTEGCKWLLENEDVGVIGIEPNPVCLMQLYYCTTTNGYLTSLFMKKYKICQFVGHISEIFLKKEIMNWDLNVNTPHLIEAIPTDVWTVINNESYHISPTYMFNHTGNFRMMPILKECKDIRGSYILLKGAIDNVTNSNDIVYQKFYSTHGTVNIGASSLREDVIEDCPKKELTEIFTVPCFSLDKVFGYVDWDKYPFIECIKIDIEGKELDALRSCKKYINKIVFFRVETFKKDDLLNTTKCDDREIIQFMNDNNFELFDATPGDYKFVNRALKEMAEENNLSW